MRLFLKWLRLTFSFEQTDTPLSLAWDAQLNNLLDGLEAGKVLSSWSYDWLLLADGNKNYHIWIGEYDIRGFAIGEYAGTSLKADKYHTILDLYAVNIEFRVKRITKARLWLWVDADERRRKAEALKEAMKSFS